MIGYPVECRSTLKIDLTQEDKFLFLVLHDYFDDVKYYKAIEEKKEMNNKENEIKSLSDKLIYEIIHDLLPYLFIRILNEIRYLLIIELTYFPYISIYIDDRNQNLIKNISSLNDISFFNNLLNKWSNFNFKESILIIFINKNIHFTWLKIYDIKYIIFPILGLKL